MPIERAQLPSLEQKPTGVSFALRLAVLIFTLVLAAAPAAAQGCAMCYSTAKSASKDGQRAISKAVLVLLVPPLGLMVFGVGFAFRYGNRRDREDEMQAAASPAEFDGEKED